MESVYGLKNTSWSKHHYISRKASSIFYELQSGGQFDCTSKYRTNRTNYNTMLLLLTIDGVGYLNYRNKEYKISKDTGFLIDCSEHQLYYSDKNDLWNMLWIHFNGCQSKAYVQEILHRMGPIFEDKNHNIKNMVLSVHRLLKSENRNIDILFSKYIVDIMSDILMTGITEGYDTLKEDIIDEAILYINMNLTKNIQLEDLCKHVGVSKSYLIRKFRSVTDYSPYEYILLQKLSEAKILLIHSNKRIHEISLSVGFESVSHFIKYFKKIEGITPLKYRQIWS
ncbi:AraC family transcriptional regulator [Vallitalea longa]|uniref:AraC family transcriptional regulator n=1 Tax=Vallitalea longa TaxID=2936439 RepID=A0A9W5YBG8_9FIRM|nr:AraC family transcriptional regulator [Vallitalea longa]GKX28213.1 AraC family transcriptional regulator [Vallitalea longa]